MIDNHKKYLIISVALFFVSIFPSPIFAGSITLSSTQLGTTANLYAIADMATCPDKENRTVTQIDLTAITMDSNGTMIGNAPPVIDLNDIRIDNLTIAGKTITNFPIISKTSRGYSYKIDPPINFGPNDQAIINVSNVKIATSGKTDVWFLLIHSNGNPMPCITGESVITIGSQPPIATSPSIPPLIETATPSPAPLVILTPTTITSQNNNNLVSKNPPINIQNKSKTELSFLDNISSYLSLLINKFFSLIKP